MGKKSRQRRLNHNGKALAPIKPLPQSEFERGYIMGEQAVQRNFEIWFEAHNRLRDLNAIATYIAGTINAGYGELPRRILKDLNNKLGAHLAKVLNAYADARRKGFGLQDPDLTHAQQIFDAVRAYLEDSSNTGEELRKLFSSWNPVYELYADLHDTLKPGRKPTQQRHTVENNEKIHGYVLKGHTIEDAIRLTLEERYQQDKSSEHVQRAIRALEGDSARRQYHNWRSEQGLIPYEE